MFTGYLAATVVMVVAPGTPLAAPSLSPQQRNRAAVAQARDRLERRKDARHLIATNPARAGRVHHRSLLSRRA